MAKEARELAGQLEQYGWNSAAEKLRELVDTLIQEKKIPDSLQEIIRTEFRKRLFAVPSKQFALNLAKKVNRDIGAILPDDMSLEYLWNPTRQRQEHLSKPQAEWKQYLEGLNYREHRILNLALGAAYRAHSNYQKLPTDKLYEVRKTPSNVLIGFYGLGPDRVTFLKTAFQKAVSPEQKTK